MVPQHDPLRPAAAPPDTQSRSCGPPPRRGKKCPAIFRRNGTTSWGVSAASGSSSSGGSGTPICLALVMRAGPMPLPRVLRALPTTSGSIVQSGTGRAVTVVHVVGSRGVSSEKTWSKVRAAASRWVNASPSPQVVRNVAISEVWRYSSLYTDPDSTHGDTMMAGTRYPERSNVKPHSPGGADGSGGGTGPGETWS